MELKKRIVLALVMVVLLWTSIPSAEPVVVRHVEGLVHGFLSLRSPEGTVWLEPVSDADYNKKPG